MVRSDEQLAVASVTTHALRADVHWPRTEQQTFRVKVDVFDRFGVALECTLELACLPIPDLDTRIVTGGDDD